MFEVYHVTDGDILYILKNLLIPFIVAAVIISFAVGKYYYTNRDAAMTNWNVFQSPMGFEIKYPREVVVTQKEECVYFRYPAAKYYSETPHLNSMNICDKSNTVKPEEPDFGEPAKITNVTLNGYEAKRFVGGSHAEIYLVASRDKKKFFKVVIDTEYDSEPVKSISFKTFTQMLSTFTLTQ